MTNFESTRDCNRKGSTVSSKPPFAHDDYCSTDTSSWKKSGEKRYSATIFRHREKAEANETLRAHDRGTSACRKSSAFQQQLTLCIHTSYQVHVRGKTPPPHPPSNYPRICTPRLSPQIGAGPSSAQRVVKPGRGLVGNAAVGTAKVAVVVTDPSQEEAFCQEVDIPRTMEGKSEVTGER